MIAGLDLGAVMRKQVAIRLLGIAVILAVAALCTHAVAHWHADAYDELHCQACQVGHSANAQIPAPVAVRPPAPTARFVPVEECAADLERPLALSIPRAPPV